MKFILRKELEERCSICGAPMGKFYDEGDWEPATGDHPAGYPYGYKCACTNSFCVTRIGRSPESLFDDELREYRKRRDLPSNHPDAVHSWGNGRAILNKELPSCDDGLY